MIVPTPLAAVSLGELIFWVFAAIGVVAIVAVVELAFVVWFRRHRR